MFLTENDYLSFLIKYSLYIEPIVDTYAYCLLPNHFHFMVKIKSEEDIMKHFKTVYPASDFTEVWDFREIGHAISHQFGRLFSSYTQSFNKKNDRKGALFIPNFKRKLVADSSYFAKLLAYIHTNPIKHGLTDDPHEWAYSSYHAYTSLKKSRVNTDVMLDLFGSKEELMKFHEHYNEYLQDLKGLEIE